LFKQTELAILKLIILKNPLKLQWVILTGGDEGARTPDLGVANAALSHLSYIPT
jgi:hypothetical protein